MRVGGFPGRCFSSSVLSGLELRTAAEPGAGGPFVQGGGVCGSSSLPRPLSAGRQAGQGEADLFPQPAGGPDFAPGAADHRQQPRRCVRGWAWGGARLEAGRGGLAAAQQRAHQGAPEASCWAGARPWIPSLLPCLASFLSFLVLIFPSGVLFPFSSVSSDSSSPSLLTPQKLKTNGVLYVFRNAVCSGVPPPPPSIVWVSGGRVAATGRQWGPCLLALEAWPGRGAIILKGSPVACPSGLGFLSWAQGRSPTMETFPGGQPLAAVPRGVQRAPEHCSHVFRESGCTAPAVCGEGVVSGQIPARHKG